MKLEEILESKWIVITRYVGMIENQELRALVHQYLDERWGLKMAMPCSLRFHHTYTGGFLDHIIDICMYGLQTIDALNLEINKDHFIAAAILHDMGRLGYYERDEETEIWRATKKHDSPPCAHAIGSILDFIEATGRAPPREVTRMILSHMGSWSETSVTPDNVPEALLHALDLICTRPDFRRPRECAHCGDLTTNYCMIERGPVEENWIEDVWVRLGFEGEPICAECYYK